MPVLINSESGLAENMSPDAAHFAAQSGSHEVPIVDPEGNLGTATAQDAQRLLAQGYSQPTEEHLHGLMQEAHYSSPEQQAIGAAEQVGKGALGPIATAIETNFGVKPEDIRGREESKGGVEKAVEQGAGLVGSLFIPGGGQAKALEKAGEMGLAALKIAPATSTIGKIGTFATKAAIENAVFQSGDEMSKMIMKDPDQSVQSAVHEIGLSAALGAGTAGIFHGGVSPLWNSTVGPRLENFLRTVSDRANGVTAPMSPGLQVVLDNADKAGLKIDPVLRAGLSEDPLAAQTFRDLQAGGSPASEALNQTIEQFKTDVGKQIHEALGGDNPLSAHEAGEVAKDAFRNKADQLNEFYNAVKPQEVIETLGDKDKLALRDDLISQGKEFGAKGSPQGKLFEIYGDRALAQNSVNDLDKLATEVNGEWKQARNKGDTEGARALSDIRTSIRDFQDSQIKDSMLSQQRKTARKVYADFMDDVAEMAGASKLGKGARTHGQFVEALDAVPSAKLADKLFDKKNIEGLRMLQEKYPEVLDALAKQKKTDILNAASTKGELMHNIVLNKVNSLSPEVQKIIFKPDELKTIQSAGEVLRSANAKINPSGTAAMLDKLQRHLPAGAGAIAGALLSHNPYVTAGAWLAGHAATYLGRDVPDAAKLSLLKFLGTQGPIDGAAWKTAGDWITKAIKGQKTLDKATKAIFKAGQEVLPNALKPDKDSREKLDNYLKKLAINPEEMLKIGGNVGHYMPDHASALGQFSANAVNYLNSVRPVSQKMNPLDTTQAVDKASQAKFNRTLDVAEQPMLVLDHVKRGTLLPQDVQTIQAIYPKLYNQLVMKTMQSMSDAIDAGHSIPYYQKQSLSLLMGQPLDSTLTPQSMMSVIMSQGSAQAPQAQQQSKPHKQSQASISQMNKVNSMYSTPLQARQVNRKES